MTRHNKSGMIRVMKKDQTYYRKEYCKMVDNYLKECRDDFDNPKIKKVNLPKIEGFAKYIGLPLVTVNKYRKEYPEFGMATEKIMEEQKSRLMDEGLAGNYNHVITKLMLGSNHGMSEKHDHTTNGKSLPTPIINVQTNEGDD